MVRIDSKDSGSNYQFADKMMAPSFARSVFNLSHQNVCTIPHQGSLIPIALFETVPNDSFDISCSVLLRVLPQVVPLYSSQRITIHAFYSRMGDLWNKFNVFMTKGYSGNRVLKVPTLNENISAKFASDSEVVTSDCLFHYLYGLPIGAKYSSFKNKVTSLPAMMYFRIWRDYFMNRYFYTDDRVRLPDVDDDFRLNDDSRLISSISSSSAPDMSKWLYRDFADDRFTSAMPSPQRGATPTLDFGLSGTGELPVRMRLTDNRLYTVDGEYKRTYKWNSTVFGPMIETVVDDVGSNPLYTHSVTGPGHAYSGDFTDSSLGLQRDVEGTMYAKFGTDSIGLQITLNDIRQLAIAQSELERMARTDGSYQEFGLTFFGRSSKNALDYRPVYIGGTYQPIVFSEVVQTSQSTDGSALGTYAGHGISQDNNGYIGKIDCDDYGYIMLVASIMPDTYYSQGVDKQFTRLYQADFFLPERAKLGAQPVYQKELYWTGNQTDDSLFAYQDIFDELRYMPNVVRGKLADKDELNFFPYTQSRHFTSAPTYSQSFATTGNGNVRKDYLFAPTEVPYTAKFGVNVRAVRPLPYQAVPASVI